MRFYRFIVNAFIFTAAISGVLAAVAVSFGAAVPVARAEGVAPRIVELLADKDNKFKLPDGSSGPLVLKSGEVIRFKVKNFFGGEKARDGAVHSFVVRKLRDKGWSVRMKEGVEEFTLTAPAPGNYLIECTVECGPGHDNMNMKMVVTK
jgi:heme/copper-type cytochrome/quinol oxidase subunit 2